MIIPHKQISADTLQAIVEEFVSREGTDYGHLAYTLESKTRAVIQQLDNGEAHVVYDEESESCSIVSASSLRAERSRQA